MAARQLTRYLAAERHHSARQRGCRLHEDVWRPPVKIGATGRGAGTSRCGAAGSSGGAGTSGRARLRIGDGRQCWSLPSLGYPARSITHVEDDEKRQQCEALVKPLGRDPDAMLYGARTRGATVTSIWMTNTGKAVGGIVSVLFTRDRRVFFQQDDGTIRVALDWERDEVFLQMLSWRDSAAMP